MISAELASTVALTGVTALNTWVAVPLEHRAKVRRAARVAAGKITVLAKIHGERVKITTRVLALHIGRRVTHHYRWIIWTLTTIRRD